MDVVFLQHILGERQAWECYISIGKRERYKEMGKAREKEGMRSEKEGMEGRVN